MQEIRSLCGRRGVKVQDAGGDLGDQGGLVLSEGGKERVTTDGFSSKRLARVREVLERYVDAGYVPGAVAVVARHGEVHIDATGTLAFEGAGSGTPMAADTICRIASTTKPIVATTVPRTWRQSS
jgi:CubicO group peptidase (beta-lactamase class C family)